jgi:integrase
MSSLQSSRPAPPARTLTLADVIQGIRHDENLPARRRHDLVSACNTAARVLGHGLAAIPADPILLRRRLAEASPRAARVDRRHWNNARSLIGQAVKTLVPVAPARRINTLTKEWARLQEPLKRPFPWARLSSLMHFASERGVPPDAVDQALFEMYRTDLLGSLRKDPELTYDAVCRAWNNAVGTVPGWPSFKVIPIIRRKTWTLLWEIFPDSLLEEILEWLRRLRGDDPVEDTPFRPLRPTTLKLREYQFRQAASALVRQGWDPASIRSLADLTTLDAFKDILRYLISRRGGIPRGQVVTIAMLLQSTARHKCHAPKEQLDAMGAIIRRIRKRQTGMTERNRSRLRALDDAAAVQKLLKLPERLVTEARRTRSPHKAALLVQTALATELLLMAPMRISNLAALDLERHIVRTAKGERVWITIEGHEVKNGATLEYPLPAPTIALLNMYLEKYRDRLVTRETTALFPGRAGNGRGPAGFGQRISRTVKVYTGLTINPHLFRHIGAKLYLEINPGAYEVVRLVLGHKSIATTTGFYTGSESEAAVRHFHQAILSRRGNGASQ